MRAALALTLVAWVFLVGPPVRSAPAAQRSARPVPLATTLDLYLQGQFDEAVKLVAANGFNVLDAQRWIAAGSGETADRRRLAAAVCALEYTAMRPQLVTSLVPWARGLFLGMPPSPAEALWLRASVALAEGWARWSFLLSGEATETRRRTAPAAAAPAIGHLFYAQRRFPDDPYFKLAEVVGAEFMTSPAVVGKTARMQRDAPGFDKLGGAATDTAQLAAAGETHALERAVAILEELLSIEAVRAEAHLRLGYIQLRLGHTDSALQHFDTLGTVTTSPQLRYLGHLYTGVTLSRLNRVSEAAASYRVALRGLPGTRSATMLLMALLLMNGQSAESETVASEFLAVSPPGDDPWRTYFHGDFPQLGPAILRLREAVR